jgi:hypothetical protein
MSARGNGSNNNNNNNRPPTPPLPDDDDDYDPDAWNANPNNIMGDAWIAAQAALDAAMPLDQDQINAIDAVIAARPIRQSRRIQGLVADNTIDECKGKTCLITRSRLAEGRGIRLSDGRCYDGEGIIAWYDRNNVVLPTRKPYDADDIAKIERWRGIIGRGGKKKRKGRKTRKGGRTRKGGKTRKGRKTRKGGKTRKGRRGRKTRKSRKSRKTRK